MNICLKILKIKNCLSEEKDKWNDNQNIFLKDIENYIESDEYQKLSDEEKYRALSTCMSMAKTYAKDQYYASVGFKPKNQSIIQKVDGLSITYGQYATYQALTAPISKNEDMTDTEKDDAKKQIMLDNYEGDDLNSLYFLYFENKNTKYTIRKANEDGIKSETFINFSMQHFEKTDDESVAEQKRNWILENSADDKDLVGMYGHYIESSDLPYYKSIAYAYSQGVDPKAVIEFDEIYNNAKGEVKGARLYYCLLNASYYMNNPIEIFYIIMEFFMWKFSLFSWI